MTAMRRVIPPGYQVHELHLEGVTPLLMSSGEADRESDTYIAYRQLSKKRGKSVEDESRLRELEWYTRLYFDDQIGVYIPGKNVKELLRSSATKWRKGADVTRSLIVPDYRIPLIYDGPRNADKLWKAGFYDVQMVSNAGPGGGRVERCRPCFDKWALKCEIAFDPEDLDATDVAEFVRRSEKYGLGDYRTGGYGAFKTTWAFLREQRGDARANGSKPRHKRDEAVVATRADRLMAK